MDEPLLQPTSNCPFKFSLRYDFQAMKLSSITYMCIHRPHIHGQRCQYRQQIVRQNDLLPVFSGLEIPGPNKIDPHLLTQQ